MYFFHYKCINLFEQSEGHRLFKNPSRYILSLLLLMLALQIFVSKALLKDDNFMCHTISKTKP